MLNAVYRLVAPRRIDVAFQDISLNGEKIVVRPTHLSICHADQRYYQGARPAEILAKKLPMALIHEGIGEVVYDPSGEFKPGDSVVMIPNTPTEKDDVIAENYLRSSKFRASGFDGFMQDLVEMDFDRVVRLPGTIDKKVAAYTELVSVSVHALRRFDKFAHSRRNVVGIWGDGNLGYITAVLFKAMFPETKLYIFGVDMEKLADFTFADEVYNVQNIPEDLRIDHAIECVGGDASQKAINQIIDYIHPEGTISILGVSEYPVPINTRMVLEKGLQIFGSSRSGRDDFQKTVDLFEQNPQVVQYLSNLVGAVVEITSIKDMSKAFELDTQKAMGKTVMVWKK
ncbi:MAG: zinc-binding dehydrogenase [Lachnospiraceae bacterium]|nr:zinc-binding dehydrogenase [Lachnospiraceae bacterium]